MDHVFKDLSHLILKVGLFPNQDVLESTGRFMELHLLLTMRVIHKGFTSFIKIPEHILASGRRQFYMSNNAKCDPYYHPFGDKFGDFTAFQAWVEKIEVGDEIDAVKFCKHENRAIWSRATVSEIAGYKVYVKFHSENSKIYHNRCLNMTPFLINKPTTRSLDFEWRESLKKGDKVDIYFGRKGWLYFDIIESITMEAEETGEKFTTVSCELVDEDDDVYSSDEEKDHFGMSH